MAKHTPLKPLEKLAAPACALYDAFPVRKTKAQKQAFRAALLPALEAAGWGATVETAGKIPQSNNVVAGDVNTAKIVFTAHYDTPARMPFPNFLAPRNLLVSLLYQLALVVVLGALFFALVFGLLWLGLPFPWTSLAILVFGFGLIWLMMAGPANPRNANDNTSGVMTLMQIACTLPPELRGQVALVFFDCEELGLIGSGRFRKAHGMLPKTLLINFDCVSDGDTLLFVPSGACRRSAATMALLGDAFAPPEGGKKSLLLNRMPLTLYPSDQIGFRLGVGVAAMRRAPLIGLYLARIHTARDTVFDEDNILLLAEGAARVAASAGGTV